MWRARSRASCRGLWRASSITPTSPNWRRTRRVPVINGLSDTQHPCQAMADMLTIYERFGRFEGVRVVYVGDGNNVALSLAQAGANFGVHFAAATPSGYSLSEEDLTQVAEVAERNGGSVEAYEDPYAAVKDADVVYTDTWVSMGQEAETETRVAALRPVSGERRSDAQGG